MRQHGTIQRLYNRAHTATRNLAYRWHIAMLRSHWAITTALRIANVLSFVGSVICLICLSAYIGYEKDVAEQLRINHIFRSLQWLFSLYIAASLVLDFRQTVRNTKPIRWIINVLVIVSLWPLLFGQATHPLIPVFQTVVCSPIFTIAVLSAYSVVDISYGIMLMLGRRTNPPLLLASSFMLFIIIGSFLLTMPRCTLVPVNYTDALFVSTSAVCITGLTPVDIAATFTPFGQIILALLIQIGGLGVLTFTSFFALFFSGGQSVYSQLLVKDMIYSKSMNSLLPTLLYILMFTLIIEAVGAVGIWLSIHDVLTDMSLSGQIEFSIFLSLSAFCNAGFTTLPDGMANATLMNSNQSIYLVVSAIVLAGSIGFPVLVNFRDACHEYARRLWYRLRRRRLVGRQVRLYNINTKISVYTTLLLFALTAVLFLVMEYHNTLQGYSFYDKCVQSIFNATTPRSSGFQSLSPASFLPSTLIIVLIMMWVGGASQSTAGGVKVNTIATLWLNLRSIVLGRQRVVAFNRTVSTDSIRRANAVVTLSIAFLAVYTVVVLLLEPALPPKAVVYEVVSALFTVGSSLGITASLSTASKLLLCTAMFLGRVGIISLLIGVTGNRTDRPAQYPTDNIIIN